MITEHCVRLSGFMMMVAVTMSPLCADGSIAVGTSKHDLRLSSSSRSFLLHVPRSYDSSTPHALILAFHAYDETPQTMATDSGLSEMAETWGTLVAYPAGKGKAWDAGSCCGGSGDDLEFVRKLLDQLPTMVNVNKKKIYLVGMSNGAMMSYRVACEMPDRIAAVAAVAGPRVTDKEPNTKVPVMHVHGSADLVIRYQGGPVGGIPGSPWKTPSIDNHIDFWVKENDASQKEDDVELSPPPFRVSRDSYSSSDPRGEVILIKVDRGGHLWPGRPFPKRYETDKKKLVALGKTNQSFQLNDEIWKFFQRH